MNKIIHWRRLAAVLLALALCGAIHAQAQRATGTGNRGNTGNRGGFGGGGFGGGGASFGGSGNRSYTPNGTVGEALISADPETRRLIVITDDETSRFISQVITNLDKPKPQVLIKVVFLEVTYRKGLDVGIEGARSKDMGNSTTGVVNQVFGLANQGANPSTPTIGRQGAGIYQVLGTDFQATLRAIAEAGKTEVLSRPSILARNNQQAVITVGKEVPLITNTRFDENNNQINTISYQDVGIILRVTPFIASDGMVELIVSPEISDLTDQTIPISGGSNPVGAPVISKRSADTVVVTPDGQTVIIGGLMSNSKSSVDSKIPLLGDIPLLGNLFKRKLRADEKTELMIFLTPHVVNQPAQVAKMTADEKASLDLSPSSFTEQELNRFIEGLPKKDEKKDDKKDKSRK